MNFSEHPEKKPVKPPTLHLKSGSLHKTHPVPVSSPSLPLPWGLQTLIWRKEKVHSRRLLARHLHLLWPQSPHLQNGDMSICLERWFRESKERIHIGWGLLPLQGWHWGTFWAVFFVCVCVCVLCFFIFYFFSFILLVGG